MMSKSPASSAVPTAASNGESDITQLGAAELARRIADRSVSAIEVCDAHIARIEATQSRFNMVSHDRFEQARQDAADADQRLESDEALPPLLGVPISVKECFHVSGLPTNLGVTGGDETPQPSDGLLVKRLRDAGAIILAKTNVPQLMLYTETTNPRFGRTVNPWDNARSCNGSGGGEAVMIAVDGAPLGLGSDMGGSLRVPAHVCGVHSFKPTSTVIAQDQMEIGLPGMQAVPNVPGFTAKRIEDLALATRICQRRDVEVSERRYSIRPEQKCKSARFAVWASDRFFPVAPAIRRAIEESAAVLREEGAVEVQLPTPNYEKLMALFFHACSADGGAAVRRRLTLSAVDPNLRSLLRLTQLPRLLRRAIARLLRRKGRFHAALLVESARKQTVDEYWQICQQLEGYRRACLEQWNHHEIDIVLMPPSPLPALPHGKANDLVTAAAYSILANVLDVPAGTVAVTRIQESEESDRDVAGRPMMKLAADVECHSAGLPVSVQVVGMPFRDRTVLGTMMALEKHFSRNADYPPARIL